MAPRAKSRWARAAVVVLSAVAATLLATASPALAGTADPASVDFGNVPVNTTATQTVTLTVDAGYRVVTVTGSGINAPFDFSFDTCGAGGGFTGPGTCTVTESFTPTTDGPATGSTDIQECTTAGGGSCMLITFSVSGTGVSRQATVTPTSLTFSGQGVGTTSTEHAVTLINAGGVPLHVGGLSVSGDFALSSDTCSGATVAVGGLCTVGVTFTPTTDGPATGTLSFTDDAVTTPQTVSLSGTGVAVAVAVSPSSLAFAARAIGTTSPADTVTLVNTGSAGVVVHGVDATGDFGVAPGGTCVAGAGIAPGGHCTVNITFTPTASGTRHGTVVVTDTSSTGPHIVALSGQGSTVRPAGPTFSVSPSRLTFTQQRVGTRSAPQTVVVANRGTGRLSFQRIYVTGDFVRTGGTCASSKAVNAGRSCTVIVTFAPKARGTRTGTITFVDNAAKSPHVVPLRGVGTTARSMTATAV